MGGYSFYVYIIQRAREKCSSCLNTKNDSIIKDKAGGAFGDLEQ